MALPATAQWPRLLGGGVFAYQDFLVRNNYAANLTCP
jgi:hypothetical protein